MPLGHMYNEVPLVKFIAYLVSHVYMLILMIMTVVMPLRPIWENIGLFPNWYEWLLLLWLSGNLVMELTNPGDIAGLGWIKVFVLVFSGFGVLVHLVGFFYLGNKELLCEMLYIRNNLLAIALLLASVQLLDFLSFHHLFGPWAVIIGKLMVDLGRFLVILMIFVFGFSMYVAAIYNPLRPIYSEFNYTIDGETTGYPPAENLVPLSNMEGPQGVRRIENVIKWSRVVNRYRIMHRKEVQPGESSDGENDMPTDSMEDLHEEALLNGNIESNSSQPANA
ncbi:Transient receptor potential cation channel subfamily M member 2 [Portunus trituberculatus]|uniref:Transient receptor potential cation channel subfamily M member 2 n=1 Tax=Portunus trituberculatus TaxID=210409 RepID=A0A5B7CSJ6_PORTR|nr:Transient receptor potential cation channel subfamily M member 2 [Portunus trituberculatus]